MFCSAGTHLRSTLNLTGARPDVETVHRARLYWQARNSGIPEFSGIVALINKTTSQVGVADGSDVSALIKHDTAGVDITRR